MALALVFTSVAEVVITTGLPEALVQRKDLDNDHSIAAFWVLLGVGVFLGLTISILADPFSTFLDQPLLASVLRYLSIVLVIQALSAVPIALLKRGLEFRALALRSMAGSVAGAIIGVSLALYGLGVWALIFSALGRASVEAIVLWSCSAWRPELRISLRHIADLRTFASWALTLRIVATFMLHFPTMVIGHVLGPIALGYYSVANKLLEFLVQLLIVPVNAIGMPVISRLQSEPYKVQEFASATAQSLSVVAFPAFCGLAAVAPDAIPLLFGEAWRPSVAIVQALALFGLMQSVNVLFGSVLQGMGRQDWLFVLVLVHGIPRAVIVITLAPFGLHALVIGLVLELYVLTPIDIWVIRRVTGVDFARPIRIVFPVLAAALGMAAAVLLWRTFLPAWIPALGALASSVAVGAVIYMALVCILAPSLVRSSVGVLVSAVQGRAGS
jgi:O-antigen/teichoic acid export membrane protein